ncbi:MAG TPA: hypothetical protein VMX97_00855, partial [Hyphomicrobiaceae bacterium]|nr:hypothetical protein [Hyphomicrobiaceae bacterium]
MGAQAAIEGGQEMFAQFAQNLIQNYVYDPNKDLTEGLAEAGTIGAIIGGGLQGGVSAVQTGAETLQKGKEEADAYLKYGNKPKEPSKAEDFGQRPADTTPADVTVRSAVDLTQRTPKGDAVLGKAGWTKEQIDELGTEQYKRELTNSIDAGVEVEPHTPAPSAPPREADGTRTKPVNLDQTDDPDEREKVREQVQEPKSPEQAEAGNYRHGHVKLFDRDVGVETKKSGRRTGKDPEGKDWSVQMPADYGKFKGTKGADGDEVDVYIGDHPQNERVWVVDQDHLGTTDFDEHKVIAKVGSAEEALRTYAAGFSDGKGANRVRGVTEMTVDELNTWLDTGDLSKPAKEQEQANVGSTQPPVQPSEDNQADVVAQEVPAEPTAPDQPAGSEGSVAPGAEIGGREPADYVDVTQKQINAFNSILADKNKSIGDLEKVAKEAGLDHRQASKLMQDAARAGAVIHTRNGSFRRAPTDKKPVDLVNFIGRTGGIQDRGGELSNIFGGGNKMIQYAGPLIRKTGRSPDDVIKDVVAEGYLPETATIRELYEAIDRNERTERVVREQDVTWEQEYQAGQQQEQIDDQFPEKWQQGIISKHGLEAMQNLDSWEAGSGGLKLTSLDDATLNRAAELVKEGEPADDAIERAAIELAEEAEPGGFDDVWEAPFDEIFTDTTPASSEAGDRDSARVEDTRAEAKTPDSGENVQSTRKEGEQVEQPATETGADGKDQAVMPGMEKITDKELAERKSEGKKKATASQKDADEGLFSDDKDQTDAFSSEQINGAVEKLKKQTIRFH